MRILVSISFCLLLCVGCQKASSGSEPLLKRQASLDNSSVEMLVARIDWLRLKSLTDALSAKPEAFKKDCALAYHISLAYDNGATSRDELNKARVSMLAFYSAMNSVLVESPLEDLVFSKEDHLDFMPSVIDLLGKCSNEIQPVYDSFSDALDRTVATK